MGLSTYAIAQIVEQQYYMRFQSVKRTSDMSECVFNPIKPEYHGYTDDGYWDEADRYIDEYLLQQTFKEEKEKNEGHSN